jgi:hypothetical protein
MLSMVDIIRAVDEIIKITLLHDEKLSADDIRTLKHYRYLLNNGDVDE